MKKSPLTSHILLIIFLAIPLPLILNIIAVMTFSSHSIKEDLAFKLKSQASNFHIKMEEYLSLNKSYLKNLSQILSYNSDVEEISEDLYEKINFEDFSTFSSERKLELCIASLSGEFLLGENTHTSFFAHIKQSPEFFMRASKNLGKPFLIFVPEDFSSIKKYTSEKPYLVLAEPIWSLTHKKKIGFIIEFQKLDDSWFLITNSLNEPLNANIFDILLVSKQGEVLASSNKSLKDSYFPPFSSQNLSISSKINAHRKDLKITPFNLDKSIKTIEINSSLIGFAYDEFPIKNLCIITTFPKKELYHSLFIKPLKNLSYYFLSLIVGGVIIIFVGSRIAKPLHSLSNCMESVRNGDYNVRYKQQSFGYEINILGETFNKTLLTFLISTEKAFQQTLEKQSLFKELSLVREIQENILLSPSTKDKFFRIETGCVKNSKPSGIFQTWSIHDEGKTLFLSTGALEGSGLASCLYALSIRTLLKTYSCINTDLYSISKLSLDNFSGDRNDVHFLLCSLYSDKFSFLYKGEVFIGVIKDGDITVLETNDPLKQRELYLKENEKIFIITGFNKNFPLNKILKSLLSALKASFSLCLEHISVSLKNFITINFSEKFPELSITIITALFNK